MLQEKQLKEIETMFASVPNVSFVGKVGVAYILLLARENNCFDIASIPEFTRKYIDDELVCQSLCSELPEKHWNSYYRKRITDFDTDSLRRYILDANISPKGAEALPPAIAKIVLHTLQCKPRETLADMGVGFGGFLQEAYKALPGIKFFGVDSNADAAVVSRIKAKVSGVESEIEQNDLFSIIPCFYRFEKIFCFPPFGSTKSMERKIIEFMPAMPEGLPSLKMTFSAEWLFAIRCIVDFSSSESRATVIMTNGALSNLSDSPIRKYFVERGMIESVISLPAGLLQWTSIPLNIVVFSNGNSAVRMVDARDLGVKNRRNAELTDQDVETVIARLNSGDEKYVKSIPVEDILKEDSVIYPERYLCTRAPLEYEVKFGDVIESITRGAALTAKQLDDLESKESTDICYLGLRDISSSGIISEELPCLKKLDRSAERSVLRENDLVISKIGNPMRVALAQNLRKRQIVVSANMFIVRLKEKLANPVYIKAFLSSEIGLSLLKSVAVGSTISCISAEALKNMPISLPPMERQQEIANRYLAKLDEIEVLKRKLDKAVGSLSSLLNI